MDTQRLISTLEMRDANILEYVMDAIKKIHEDQLDKSVEILICLIATFSPDFTKKDVIHSERYEYIKNIVSEYEAGHIPIIDAVNQIIHPEIYK